MNQKYRKFIIRFFSIF